MGSGFSRTRQVAPILAPSYTFGRSPTSQQEARRGATRPQIVVRFPRGPLGSCSSRCWQPPAAEAAASAGARSASRCPADRQPPRGGHRGRRPAHPAARSSSAIPRRPGRSLSHDGKQLAFRAGRRRDERLGRRRPTSPTAAKPVTKDTSRGIRQYFWAYTNKHILYLQDKGGDENWHVYSVDLATGETKDLTPFDKVAAQIQGVSDEVSRTRSSSGSTIASPSSTTSTASTSSPASASSCSRTTAFAGFVTDDDYKVRFAHDAARPDGGMDLLQPDRRTERSTPFESIGPDDTLTTQPVGFDKTGQHALPDRQPRPRHGGARQPGPGDGRPRRWWPRTRAPTPRTCLAHPTEKNIQAVVVHLRPRALAGARPGDRRATSKYLQERDRRRVQRRSAARSTTSAGSSPS